MSSASANWKLSRAKCATILAFTCLTFSLVANSFEPTAMRFDRLSMNEGLSQSHVMAITQDQTGFMWFATENGLDRYDGFTFKHYRRERGNPDTLSSDFVRDLSMSDDGSLWIATDDGGIAHWRPDEDSFVPYRHNPQDSTTLATDQIRTLLSDPRGYVWVGTRDSGLDRLNVRTGEVTHYAHDEADPGTISNNEIHALALAEDGALWIGTRNGLNRLDPATGSMRRFYNDSNDPTSLSDNAIRSLLVTHDGTLWVGTNRGGLNRFDVSTGQFERSAHSDTDRHSLSGNRVEVIFEDDSRRIWVGTNNGLNLMHAETGMFTNYRNDQKDPSSISDDSVVSIFQDRGGMLWVGTFTGGLNKWNPRSWSFGHFKPDASEGDAAFSNPNVTSFAEGPDKEIWVGTFGGGVNIMDGSDDSIRQLRHDSANADSLSDDRVMALLTDRRGHIWIGTMRGGLNRVEPGSGTNQVYRHDPANPASLAADGIMSLMEDSDGNIWVGTFGGGVSRLDDRSGVFTNFRHDPTNSESLSSPRATSLVQGTNGVIWVGTDGGGLNRLGSDGRTWQQIRHDPDDPTSLSTDTVYALHADNDGNLWVGTRAGLDQIMQNSVSPDAGQFQTIATSHRLSNNAVYSIQSDSEGRLWLSTNHGLIRYNPATASVRSFHESQGLQGEEFNFGAGFTSSDGSLYFGGANGFNAFVPSELEFNQERPQVVLTSLSILNRPVSDEKPYEIFDRVDLDYSDDVVTFEVSALDFAASGENRYAYRLEGFDDDWVEAGPQRRFTYTNLDGGEYLLRVKAANSDGQWNEDGMSLSLSVAYPPWHTWWAYTLYLLAALLAAYGLWHRQQQKLLREAEYSRRLEQEVRDRTSELKDRNADLKEVNAKLVEASTTDALTGLRNRRFLFEQVIKDVDLVLRHYRDGTETMKPGGNNDLLFLMVDLDHFKPVNDSCGHEAGDEMLLQVRDVLLDACRFSDDVIRWGGDEFLIVARETNRKFAATLAERVRSGLSQRVFSLGNGQVARTSASIGYAAYPFIKDRPDLLTWEEVLGVADAAMYEAKKKRNAWLGIEGIDWSESGDALYRAIKTDPGQLAEDGVIQAIESIEEAAENLA